MTKKEVHCACLHARHAIQQTNDPSNKRRMTISHGVWIPRRIASACIRRHLDLIEHSGDSSDQATLGDLYYPNVLRLRCTHTHTTPQIYFTTARTPPNNSLPPFYDKMHMNVGTYVSYWYVLMLYWILVVLFDSIWLSWIDSCHTPCPPLQRTSNQHATHSVIL